MSCEAHTPLPSTALGWLSRLGHMATSYKSKSYEGNFPSLLICPESPSANKGSFQNMDSSGKRTITLKIFLGGNLMEHPLMNVPCQNSQEYLPAGPNRKHTTSTNTLRYRQPCHLPSRRIIAGCRVTRAQPRNQCGLELKGKHEKKEGFQSWFLQGPHAN